MAKSSKKAPKKRPKTPVQTPATPVSLSIPTEREIQAQPYFSANTPQTLTQQVVVALVEKLGHVAAGKVLEVAARLEKEPELYPSDLVALIQHEQVRQLVFTETSDGWEVQVMPRWETRFLTLLTVRRHIRRYKQLDTLVESITKHGRLPPTILIGI